MIWKAEPAQPEIPSRFTTQIRDIPAGNESASWELIENTVRGWKFEVGEMKGIHIGEVLVEQGAITKEQLNEGLKQLKAETNDRRLAEVLTELGYITCLLYTSRVRRAGLSRRSAVASAAILP